MKLVYIKGTKKEINDNLKVGKDVPTLTFLKKVERYAMLSEHKTGTSINLWSEQDAENFPIVKSFGVYNKVTNRIE